MSLIAIKCCKIIAAAFLSSGAFLLSYFGEYRHQRHPSLHSQFTINFSGFLIIEIIGEARQEFGRFLPLVPGDSLLSPRPSPI